MDNRLADEPLRPTSATVGDRLEAMGRVERRRLLLELSTGTPDDAHVDLGELTPDGDELDPLVAMHHLHLPILEERGFVRWDRETDRVTRGPRFDELEPFLDLLREVLDDATCRE